MTFEDGSFGLSLEPNRSSRHSLGIHASPAEVYRALTDPAVLTRWFVSEAVVDLQPGGAFRWVFGRASGDPGPAPLQTSGIFLSIKRQESMVLRAVLEELETEIEFRIDPWRDGAILTVSHSGFPGDEEWDDTFRAIDRGWQTELHVLKVFLERGRDLLRSAERYERRIPGSCEEVFDAFTTQAGLTSWLSEQAAIDPMPGAEFLLGWNGQPEVRGRVAICDPDSFLVLTWERERPSLVRLTLDDEEGTKPTVSVTVDHIRLAPSLEAIERFGWAEALGRLEAAVKRGNGR
jgi:uncharacterized protein YndB with AHSA1/START domain